MLPDSELRRPAPAVPAELRQWLPLPNYRDFIENIRADHWYFTKTWHHNIFRRKRQALFCVHWRHARRSTYIIHEPVEKASVLLPVCIVFHNRHSITTSSKWQALSIHESVTQGPLYLFFSMCPLYRFLVKWQAFSFILFACLFLVFMYNSTHNVKGENYVIFLLRWRWRHV